MQPTEIALAATGYTTKLASLVMEQEQKIAELEAVIAAFSRPSAYPPVAEVPVRVVTGIELPEENE